MFYFESVVQVDRLQKIHTGKKPHHFHDQKILPSEHQAAGPADSRLLDCRRLRRAHVLLLAVLCLLLTKKLCQCDIFNGGYAV